MKNIKKLFSFLIITLLSGMSSYSQSNVQGVLELKFKILPSKVEKTSNVVFKIFENDKEIKKVEGNESIISLDLNKTFVVEVSDSKMIKYVQVNTNVPDIKKGQPYKYTCKFRYCDEKDSYDKPTSIIIYEKNHFVCRSMLIGVSLVPKK